MTYDSGSMTQFVGLGASHFIPEDSLWSLVFRLPLLSGPTGVLAF